MVTGARTSGQKAAWWAWLIYAAFVVYGSLVPFDFHPVPWGQAWLAFKQIPFLSLGVESRADWVANGVLYVPLGLLGARALRRLGSLRGGAVLALIIACGLALVVEFVQQFFPPRTVSQNDLIAEALGSAVGVVSAVLLAPWLQRLRRSIVPDAPQLVAYALPAYVAAYLLYCFFPFDLLLSPGELRDKLAGQGWGWLLARPEGHSPFRALLQTTTELLLSVPIGFILARKGTVSPIAAAALGGVVGLGIELGQLFIASGVSQGMSVLSRAVGAAAGAWAWPLLQAHGAAPARRWLARWSALLVWPWLLLVVLASGWGTHASGGLARAQANWEQTRFLPFYYHYYTTEALALTSLASVVVLYAPLALLAWSRHLGAGTAASMAVLLSGAVEMSKLFLLDAHPDPTNVLIAAASVWLLLRLVQRVGHRAAAHVAVAWPYTGSAASVPQPATATPTLEAPPAAGPRSARLPLATLVALVPLALVVVAVLSSWPAARLVILLWIAVVAGLTWWRPVTLLAALPLALPVFDLAPWTGRYFVDEFDLLFIACVPIAWLRSAPAGRDHAFDTAMLVFLPFGLSLVLSTLKGMGGDWAWDANILSHYYSVLNGLRIAKGALWAWIFVLLYQRLVQRRAATGLWFDAGMVAGLVLTVMLVVWERLAFVGPVLDFDAIYRVTGPFSTMHKGGAYIECWLAVASAFVVAVAVTSRHRVLFWACTALLLPTAYAVLVTYSRNGYAAFAWVMLAALLLGLHLAWGRGRALLALGVMVTLVMAAALPILGGSHAQARLAESARDFDIRLAHWKSALQLRDDSLGTSLFGVGVGRFPEAHFWNSREPRAADFRIEPGDGNPHLRLGVGAPVYIDQIIEPPPGQELKLVINLRSAAGAPELTVALCRKWTLSSSDCEQAVVKGIDAPGQWQTQDATLAPLPAPNSAWEALAPLRLSLMTPAQGGVVDVDNVSLAVEKGAELVTNGSFARGMDRWFFATDVDPPWHIHSLPVALWFDQGMLGLLSAAALFVVAVVRGARAAWRGSPSGLAAFVGLVAFLISGTLNTLIDSPRFLWLLLVLAWLCVYWGRDTRRPARAAP